MKLEIDITIFDSLSSDCQNVLRGGYSSSYTSMKDDELDSGEANNCLGGNCTSLCGAFQNLGCNKYAGCTN